MTYAGKAAILDYQPRMQSSRNRITLTYASIKKAYTTKAKNKMY